MDGMSKLPATESLEESNHSLCSCSRRLVKTVEDEAMPFHARET
jgi:hypothetical protein